MKTITLILALGLSFAVHSSEELKQACLEARQGLLATNAVGTEYSEDATFMPGRPGVRENNCTIWVRAQVDIGLPVKNVGDLTKACKASGGEPLLRLLAPKAKTSWGLYGMALQVSCQRTF